MFALLVLSFVLSSMATRGMMTLAPRIGFVDKPGGRKIHADAIPLGGGVGIALGFALPLLIGLVLLFIFQSPPTQLDRFLPRDENFKSALWSGAREQSPLLIAILAGALVLHLLGLVDDRRALGPYLKLIVQLVVAAAVVILFPTMRILTALDAPAGGTWLSVLLTIFWITAITNAFNFLDNMDGLSAGVAAICGLALLIASCTIGQWFVAGMLACLVGALFGFLVWNFPPAKIFMGDGGSLLVGFVLALMSARTTFLPPDVDFDARWYAVFAPVILLALPLYDLVVVSAIRIARGKSPFVGDKNHFSHRLVNRGMSRRTAVLCLYLVTASTSIAAIILPQVRSTLGALLIVLQTGLVLGVVMLLEQHPIDPNQRV